MGYANDFFYSNFEWIRQWLNDQSLRVCIFGAGRYGCGSGYILITQWLGFKVSCFCDNDSNKWGSLIVGDIPCISPQELIDTQSRYLCFLAVGVHLQDDIIEQMQEAGVQRIIPFAYPWSEIVITEVLRKKFYSFDYSFALKNNFSNSIFNQKKHSKSSYKKIVVYTCVTNDYDIIQEPLSELKNVDWVIISENPLPNNSMFQWYNIKKIVPKTIEDPALQNRYCKINAHLIFSQYDASIYVDGNVQIIGNVLQLMDYVGESGIATHVHPVRNCLFDEGIICSIYKKADVKKIKSQIELYHDQGMPANFGLFELNVLVRLHNKTECIQIMETWWNEVACMTHRDQLSFTYALWKNGFKSDCVGVLGGNVKNNSLLRVLEHRTGVGEARATGLIQSKEFYWNKDNIIDNFTNTDINSFAIVIRTVGEQTTHACLELLQSIFNSTSIFVVNEKPFEQAIRKTFQIGIDSGLEWTLVIDADVLVDLMGITEMIKKAQNIPNSVFAIQGLVFDKYFDVYRPAGNHIYRTALLEHALSRIPKPGESLRPETTLIDSMISDGYEMIQCSAVIGIHDFGQSYVDIAKKAFLQSHKHFTLNNSLLHLWKSKASDDLDFYAALLGWQEGQKYKDTVYVDSEFIENKVRMVIQSDSILSLVEQRKLKWTCEDVKSILNKSCRRLNNELQAEFFSRALWDRIYYKKE